MIVFALHVQGLSLIPCTAKEREIVMVEIYIESGRGLISIV